LGDQRDDIFIVGKELWDIITETGEKDYVEYTDAAGSEDGDLETTLIITLDEKI
jgi:hypothetical protein